MTIVLTILHIVACMILILVVLLQSGKAADLAGAFGGMGSQTAFGPRGAATVLTKATTICAVVFMLTSLTLAGLATRRAGPASVLQRTGKTGTTPAPAAPAPKPGAPAQQQAPAQQPGAPQQAPAQQPAPQQAPK